jgi:hypothetical protein
MALSMYDKLVKEFPELKDSIAFYDGTIILQNDADDAGDYIVEWHYSKSLPKGFKVGK